MQEIDFLPPRYREAHAQRSRTLWGLLVVVLYAGLLSTSGYLQKNRHAKLAKELEQAKQQKAVVAAQVAHLAALQEELGRVEASASLIAYLRHPWPRTQVVAAIVRPLEEGVQLTELHLQRLEMGSPTTAGALPRNRPPTSATDKQDTRPPALRDLERLRELCARKSAVVTLKGTATDVALVHMYLGRLGKSELFSRVDLMNLDGREAQTASSLGCRFTARLVLRPGYGQPQLDAPQPGAVQITQHAGRLP